MVRANVEITDEAATYLRQAVTEGGPVGAILSEMLEHLARQERDEDTAPGTWWSEAREA